MITHASEQILDELETAIEHMPPPAIGAVLSLWQERIDEIRSQLAFVNAKGGDQCAATREAETLKQCMLQITAACAVERGDGMHAFELMLKQRDPRTGAPTACPMCRHNAMVQNDEPGYAWRCADCGYVYGQ